MGKWQGVRFSEAQRGIMVCIYSVVFSVGSFLSLSNIVLHFRLRYSQ